MASGRDRGCSPSVTAAAVGEGSGTCSRLAGSWSGSRGSLSEGLVPRTAATAYGFPRVPGNLDDNERDQEADDRVADASPQRDEGRAEHDAERDKAVDTSMVPVGDESRTRQLPSRS